MQYTAVSKPVNGGKLESLSDISKLQAHADQHAMGDETISEGPQAEAAWALHKHCLHHSGLMCAEAKHILWSDANFFEGTCRHVALAPRDTQG